MKKHLRFVKHYSSESRMYQTIWTVHYQLILRTDAFGLQIRLICTLKH